jgi:hypothetical protein
MILTLRSFAFIKAGYRCGEYRVHGSSFSQIHKGRDGCLSSGSEVNNERLVQKAHLQKLLYDVCMRRTS